MKIKPCLSRFQDFITRLFSSIPKRNLLFPLIFFLGSLFYLEIITHLFIYHSIDGKIIYPIIFAIPMGLFFTIITGFFSRNVNIIIMWLVTAISCLIFLYSWYITVFLKYILLSDPRMAQKAISEFGDDINNAILSNLLPLLLLMLPLLVLHFMIKDIFLCEKEVNEQGFFVGIWACHFIALLSLPVYGKADYTPYDLYHHNKVPELTGRQLGVITFNKI